MKRLNKILAFAVGTAMLTACLPNFGHDVSAKSASWGESFESYEQGIGADSIGWQYTRPKHETETFDAKVEEENGNKYLHVSSEIEDFDKTGSRVYGVSLDAAGAIGAASGENFTVEYDLKMDDDIDTGAGEYYFGLSGLANMKGCYMTFYGPKTSGAAMGKTHWPGTSGLLNEPAAYLEALGAETVNNEIIGQAWNNYRWVVHTISYGTDNKYTADYAELYVNGKYTAKVPVRFGGAELKYINLGFEKRDVKKAGFCIDNIKIYDGEIPQAGAESYEYNITPENITDEDFSDLQAGTTFTNGDRIYRKDVDNHKRNFTVNTNSNVYSVGVFDGGRNKSAGDKYLGIGYNADGTAGNYTELQISTGLTLAEGTQYIHTFDYYSDDSKNLDIAARNSGTGLKSLVTLKNGIITFKGQSTVSASMVSYDKTKWHRMIIIITHNADCDKVTVYADGNKLIDNADWQKTSGDYQRFDMTGFGFIDNFSLKTYSGSDEYEPAVPNLIKKGSDINSGYCNGTLYVGNKTAGEVLTAADLNHDVNLISYCVTDESGNAVSPDAAAAGKKLNLETPDMNYSIPMTGNSFDRTIKASDWNTADSKKAATAQMNEADGVFGSDSSIMFVQADDYSGTRLATASPNGKSVPSFWYMSVLGKSDTDLRITGRIGHNDETGTTVYSGGHNLVRLLNGKIFINDASSSSTTINKSIGSYSDNEWIRIELAFFPGQSKYSVKINDGEAQMGTFGVNGTEWDMVLNGYIQLQVPGGKPAVAMSELTSYTGIPADVSKADITGVGSGLLKRGKTIYTPYGRNPEAYVSADKLSVTDNAEKLCFTDADGKETSAAVDGGKAVVRSNDGIYSFYNIKSRENNCTIISGNNSETIYLIDSKRDETVPVIYEANYDSEGNLSAVKEIGYTSLIDGVSYAVSVAVSAQTRRIMVWDKNTMEPITQSIGTKPGKIYLVSDSICKTYTESLAPLKGWGQYINLCFEDAGIAVDNRAEGGRSTKTFREEGRWEEDDMYGGVPGVMATLAANDYVFISMGHNDQAEGTERYTSISDYKENLRNYIKDTWSKGAKAVLITPPTDRWGSTNTLLTRSNAMKEVAEEMGVTLLDLNAESWTHFEETGLEASRNKYYCTKDQIAAVNPTYLQAHPNGDLTHFNENGAKYLAKTIAELLKASGDPLGNFTNPTAVEAD